MKRFLILFLFSILSAIGFGQNAGYSLDFDGTNDFIAINSNFGITNTYTIELWFKTSTTSPSCLFGQANNTPPNTPSSFIPVISITSTGTLRAESWTSAIGAITTTTTYNDGKWHHVAFVTTSSNQILYVDGNQIGTRSATLNITFWTTTQIGTGYDAGSPTRLGGSVGWKYINAKIDEVRIWNDTLSFNTIKAWCYRQINSSHPSYSNLVAYYNLNEGTGTSANNSISSSYNGSLTNFGSSPWVSSYAPMISNTNNFTNNIAATWPAKATSSSSIMSVLDTISGDAYVVYAHNNNPMLYNSSDKPSNIIKRLSRSWKLEKEGSLNGEIRFDYTGLDTSGFYTYKLLVSSDTSFANASYLHGTKLGSNLIKFTSINFQDSFFYTFGAYDFQVPTVSTNSIDEVMAFTAKVTGRIIDDGGLSTTRGVCWSTSANPTTALTTKTNNGNGLGTYQANITGLSANTSYHVRAYAINSLGTVYGADSSFTTPAAAAPTVLTSGALTIYTDSVYYRGNVTSDGNVTVTERGFCWGSTSNPTTASNKVIVGSGKGIFTSMITGMSPATTYHIRAYAINSIGTSYGADSSVTTLSILAPTVITGNITSVLGRSAIASGQITFDGRRSITQKGVCWSTAANPTTALSTKSAQGSGTASFNYSITGLNPNTLYHVRAYATNAVGTSYGGDSSFLTAAPPAVTFDKVTSVGYTTASVIATVQNDGRQSVTARGVCWSTYPNPTLINAAFKASGSGTGNYFVALTGLASNTKYYIRAYAINSVDTSYSVDSIFYTIKILPPVVSTSSPTLITSKGAKVGGTVTADGGAAVILRGICWSTSPNPKANLGTRSVQGSGLGGFTYTISTLARGTTYHIRAFGINSADTGYGGDSTFKTLDAPLVTTDSIITIDAYKINCIATVTADGGTVVTKRGVCWDTKPAPKAKLATATNDGTGLGQFTALVTPLNPGTTYYIRAYAINSVDTAYGVEKTYTSPTFAVVTTSSPITSITGLSAQAGGNVVSGNNVTQRGVVWGLAVNPTINLATKTYDGSGLGSFSSNITSLSVNTLYHVRAYATNKAGTAYGSDVSFTTADKPTVITGSISITSPTTANCDGNVTADGRMSVTSRGIAWNNVPSKVYSLQNKTSDGAGTGSFTGIISPLYPYTTYFMCAYAINSVDTAFGAVKTIIVTPPVVITGTTYNVSKTSASLSGNAHAMGKATICYFEYGTSTAYGSKINGSPYSFADSIYKPINAGLTGLTKNTTYHYRLVAESSHGKTYGLDSIFSTENDNSIADKPAINEAIISTSLNQLKVEITMQNWEKANILVTDLSGKEIIRKENTGKLFIADLPEVQAIYIVKLNIDQKNYTQKVMVK